MKVVFSTSPDEKPTKFFTNIEGIHTRGDCIGWISDTKGYKSEPYKNADIIVTVKENTILRDMGIGIIQLSRPEKEILA